MDKKNEITLEGVLAGFDAMLAKSAAEFDRKLEQSQAVSALEMQKIRELQAETAKQTKKGFEDEYDILLFNGQAVCIVEVKYKADSNDVQQVLRKERTFRANFPEHNHKKLYLALASRSFHPLTEKACKDNGIVIMKQFGDTITIYDENLKTF